MMKEEEPDEEDFPAVIYQDKIFCKACLPNGIDENELELIVPGTFTTDNIPICSHCGTEHLYAVMEEDDPYLKLVDTLFILHENGLIEMNQILNTKNRIYIWTSRHRLIYLSGVCTTLFLILNEILDEEILEPPTLPTWIYTEKMKEE